MSLTTTETPTQNLLVTPREDKEQTPCEAISHGDILPGIPQFPSFAEERRHVLVHMAAVFRSWSRQGFTEGQAGHISVRDPEYPGLIWMNPLSRHFGMLRAGNMLALDLATGRIAAGRANPATGGRTANRAGYLIHAAVHAARPDVHAVCHAHTAAGRAWSAFARPLEMLTQDACNFYGAQAVYGGYGGIVFGGSEGERIAEVLRPRNVKVAVLRNHGLVTVGKTVDEAGYLFGLLDRSCAIQLQVEAASAGGRVTREVIGDEEAAENFRMASEENVLYREAQGDVELEIEAAGGEEALAQGFDELKIVV